MRRNHLLPAQPTNSCQQAFWFPSIQRGCPECLECAFNHNPPSSNGPELTEIMEILSAAGQCQLLDARAQPHQADSQTCMGKRSAAVGVARQLPRTDVLGVAAPLLAFQRQKLLAKRIAHRVAQRGVGFQRVQRGVQVAR